MKAYFEFLEEEFQALTSQVQKQFGSGNDAAVEKLFMRCEAMYQSMRIEARKDPSFEDRLELYRIQLQALQDHHHGNEMQRDDPREQEIQQNKNRSSFFSFSSSSALSTRLKLSKQNATLDRARTSMASVEDVAGTVVEELQRNRDTLETNDQKIDDFRGLTNEANRVLTSLKKRWF